MATVNQRVIESAPAVFTLPGEDDSGDRHTIVALPGGALVAVIDGLGHGSEAAEAAERAVASIEQHAAHEPLETLVKRCHTALLDTRGAVMNLAVFDARESTLTWIGVGDVHGRLLLKTSQPGYAQQDLLLRPGVVGRKLPPLQASVTRVRRGDLLIFATDGILPEFAENIRMERPAGEIAENIVEHYCKKTDDALALVVRYIG